MRLAPLYFFSLIGVALVLYFSWVPSPRLALLGYLPAWLANWVDKQQNENLRTAVPMVFLGLVTGSWLVVTRRNWLTWIMAWGGLTVVVFIAELGQLVLPERNFDWADVGWGTVGAFAGLLLAALFKR